jgi:hypothetical protein
MQSSMRESTCTRGMPWDDAIINQVSNVHVSTHARQGGLRHTSTQAPAVVDPTGADFPAAHCTDSQTRQNVTLHARQDDAQLR